MISQNLRPIRVVPLKVVVEQNMLELMLQRQRHQKKIEGIVICDLYYQKLYTIINCVIPLKNIKNIHYLEHA